MTPGSWQQERSGLWSLRSKRQLLPIADLNADGDAIDWLTVPRDIMPTLSVLVGDDGQATHTVKTDTSGRLALVGTTPSATAPPVYTSSYPTLVASHALTAETATVVSPVFDPRSYTTLWCYFIITAISGTGASLTAVFQVFDVAMNQWVSLVASTTRSAVNAQLADNSYVVTPFAVGNATAPQQRPGGSQARIAWLIVGTTPSVTFASSAFGA